MQILCNLFRSVVIMCSSLSPLLFEMFQWGFFLLVYRGSEKLIPSWKTVVLSLATCQIRTDDSDFGTDAIALGLLVTIFVS